MSGESLLQPGLDLGRSDWVTVSEEMNQSFADVTLDPIAMEVDGQRFAHGTLTTSLPSHLLANAMQLAPASYVEDGYLLNYGYNKIRLIESVPLGARIRGHFRTSEEGPTDKGNVVVIPIDVTVEIEGMERPALAGQIVTASQR
jgi:acyl dehydratase